MCLFFFIGAAESTFVALGGFNSKANPYMSIKAPGLHYCEDGIFPSARLSYFERKIKAEFYENKALFCVYQLNSRTSHIWSDICSKSPFLAIYVGNQRILKNLCTSEANKTKVFSKISVKDSPNTIVTESDVEASNPVDISEGEKIQFRIEKINNNHLTTTHHLSITTLILASTAIAVICYSFIDLKSSHHLPTRLVWRLPIFAENTFLFSTSGLILLITIFIIFTFHNAETTYDTLVPRSSIVSTSIATACKTFISRFFGKKSSESDFLSPFLFLYAFLILPLHSYSLVSTFWDSFFGFRVKDVLFVDIPQIIMAMVVTRGVGRVINTVQIKDESDSSSEPEKIHFSSAFSKWLVLYTCIICMLTFGISHNVFRYFFESAQLDIHALFHATVSISSVSAVYGMLRTLKRITLETPSWMEDHITVSFIASLSTILPFILHLSQIRSFTSFLFTLYLITSQILIVFFILVASSFIPSFFTVFATITRKTQLRHVIE